MQRVYLGVPDPMGGGSMVAVLESRSTTPRKLPHDDDRNAWAMDCGPRNDALAWAILKDYAGEQVAGAYWQQFGAAIISALDPTDLWHLFGSDISDALGRFAATMKMDTRTQEGRWNNPPQL
jgi:hypothetical protein